MPFQLQFHRSSTYYSRVPQPWILRLKLMKLGILLQNCSERISSRSRASCVYFKTSFGWSVRWSAIYFVVLNCIAVDHDVKSATSHVSFSAPLLFNLRSRPNTYLLIRELLYLGYWNIEKLWNVECCGNGGCMAGIPLSCLLFTVGISNGRIIFISLGSLLFTPSRGEESDFSHHAWDGNDKWRTFDTTVEKYGSTPSTTRMF